MSGLSPAAGLTARRRGAAVLVLASAIAVLGVAPWGLLYLFPLTGSLVLLEAPRRLRLACGALGAVGLTAGLLGLVGG